MKAADPYRETVRLSPNRGGKITPKYIILHHTAGNYAGSVDWCLRPESQVSYHYIINPVDGSRTQLVYDTRRAWHAGKAQWDGITDLNTHSIGIAFDRDTNTRDVSEVEVDSCAYKCVYLMDKFGIPIKHILTHQMIAPTRKDDCSKRAYDAVIARVKQLVA